MKNFAIKIIDKFVPRKFKDSIVNLGFNIARERFVELAFLYTKCPDMYWGLAGIRDRGFSPTKILDIGAYHGEWAQMACKIWPSTKLSMIEANLEKQAVLSSVANDIGADLHFELLGSKAGQVVDFHVMESGSSIFEENSSVARRTESRPVKTLDSLLSNQTFDLIKMDTQGSEIEILKGGMNIAKNADAILMEVALIQTNKGAPIMPEIIEFMHKIGFIPYEILEIHRRPLDKANNQVDIFFVKENSDLLVSKFHSTATL